MTYFECWQKIEELVGPAVEFCLEVKMWRRENGDRDREWQLYLPKLSSDYMILNAASAEGIVAQLKGFLDGLNLSLVDPEKVLLKQSKG